MTPADSPVQESTGPESTRPSPGREKWWTSTPKVVAAISGLLIAVTGLIGALNQTGWIDGDQDPTPTPETSTEITSPPVDPLFRGFILRRPSLEVRAEPALTSRVVGYLSYDTDVYIVCTVMGDPVEGPGANGGPAVLTPLWDRVRTDPAGHDIGFVPDAWVKTGTTAPQAAGCRG